MPNCSLRGGLREAFRRSDNQHPKLEGTLDMVEQTQQHCGAQDGAVHFEPYPDFLARGGCMATRRIRILTLLRPDRRGAKWPWRGGFGAVESRFPMLAASWKTA